MFVISFNINVCDIVNLYITMSYTFTLSGSSSELSSNVYPPLELENNNQYEIAMLNFETFNSIPNINSTNNKFVFYDSKNVKRTIEIPTGTYEIDDINSYLKTAIAHTLNYTHDLSNTEFFIKPNTSTMKTELKCPYDIDFQESGTLASVLGFSNRYLIAHRFHVSDNSVNVFGVSVIRIECNLATGSFLNGKPTHSIYEFFPTVPPGYHITQEPTTPIYLPITNIKCITDITLRVVDQHGCLISFQNETITIRVHIRKHGA